MGQSRVSAHGGTAATCLAAVGAVLWLSATAWCDQEPARAIDRAPFDRVELTEANQGAVIETEPLDFPGRRLPEDPDPEATFQLRPLERPGRLYEVQWRHVARVALYEQMVLGDAEQLAAAGNFGEAYDHYLFLTERYPQTPGLEESFNRFLSLEARALFQQQKWSACLARLLELHARNPRTSGLARQMDRVGEELIAESIEAQDPRAARHYIELLKSKLPADQVPGVDKLQRQLIGRAQRLLEQARRHVAEGEFRLARQASDELMRLWPDLPGAEELARLLVQRYPVVRVGVFLPAPTRLTTGLDDPASWRGRSLQDRLLVEADGVGSDGADFRSPFGRFSLSDNGLELTLLMEPIEGTSPVFSVADQLLNLAQPKHPLYRPDWARALQSLRVVNAGEIQMRLQSPHPSPLALLQVPVELRRPDEGPPGQDLLAGPYRPGSRDAETVAFVLHRPSGDGTSLMPVEIVERHFVDPDSAIAALRDGHVDVVSRVLPWRRAELADDVDLLVRPYAFPTQHVLIPNYDKPLMRDRSFRRALVYAIPRQRILQEQLLAGSDDGGRVIPGIFPVRRAYDDPLGYASDAELAPRPYRPRLAMTLAVIAARRTNFTRSEATSGSEGTVASAGPQEREDEQSQPLPPLTILHPGEPLSRSACAAIRRHLALIGLEVRLVERKPGEELPDHDLRYAELRITEPVADVWNIFGSGKLVSHRKPYIDAMLTDLLGEYRSRHVGAKLRRLNQLVHDDATVIPLWQTVNWFAHRRTISGIGQNPPTLYHHVERWRLSAAGSTDAGNRN